MVVEVVAVVAGGVFSFPCLLHPMSTTYMCLVTGGRVDNDGVSVSPEAQLGRLQQ